MKITKMTKDELIKDFKLYYNRKIIIEKHEKNAIIKKYLNSHFGYIDTDMFKKD